MSLHRELIANNVREDPARANDPDYNGPALPAWIPNAIRALVAEDPLTVTLSGPKVDSFAANLVGYQRAVTNDTHQADLFGIPQKELGGSINRAGTYPRRSPAYHALSAITRKAADILTMQTGQVWTAA